MNWLFSWNKTEEINIPDHQEKEQKYPEIRITYKMKKDFEEFAREIVTLYHSKEKATEAEKTFVATFQKGTVPEEVTEIRAPYMEALVSAGIVASKSDLRRLLAQGGVRNAETDEKLTEIPEGISTPLVLKIGKRRFVKLLP